MMRFWTYSRSLLRPLKSLAADVNAGRRTLFAENVLGLDEFDRCRQRASIQFHEMKDRFIDRMQECVKTDVPSLVLTDDLKNVIFLAEDNTKDVELVVQMLKKFNTQNKELRFGNFIFGPVVMRLLYTLDEPDTAFRLITDSALQGFFDQVASFTVTMDLLFVRQRYEDVLAVYEVAQNRQLNSSRFPRDPTILALAACYKLNTADSLQAALKIIRSAQECAAFILRKGHTFASALAIKQKDPHLALEIVSLCKQSGYFTVRNLRVLALAEMDRLDEAIMDLKYVLERDIPKTKDSPELFCREVLDVVKAAADRLQSKEHSQKLKRLEQALEENGWISSASLDSSLCSPITAKPEPRNRRLRDYTGFESKFYVSGGTPSGYRTPRRGLQDLDD